MDNVTKNKIRNWFKKMNGVIKYIKKDNKGRVNISSNYELKFEDNFDGELTDKWRRSHSWGWFHPANLYQYYDREGKTSYIKNNKLILETKLDPVTVIKSELPDWQQSDLPDEFTIPYNVGLLVSHDNWKYGWFKADIKLPKGKHLWPAFWLSGAHSWPPEIDIFEAYSNDDGNFGKKILGKTRENWRIQPNFHYGVVEEGTKEMWGAVNNPVWNATNDFVEYALHWEKDFIRIYYAGTLVSEITDKETLNWYNCEKCGMKIILNNGINKVYEGADDTIMVVKNVQVYQN